MRPTTYRITPKRAVARRALKGGIALMTAILLPVMFAFAAFVVDLGRMYVFKAEVQNAMDGCALAAVASLNGSADPTIFDTARAHGLTPLDPSRVGTAARDERTVNKLHFQRDFFTLADVNVEYSTSMSGPWVEATSASYGGITPQTARYARCTYIDRNNPLFFMPVLRVLVPGAATQLDVAAYAAAALRPSQSTCVFPVAVCKAPGSTAATNFGLTVGQRLTAVNNPGSGYGTGNFGWLDFTPPSGGASELAALIRGSGSCAVSVGATVGQPGVINSLQSDWNTRFGVYASSISSSSAPPDFSGYSYPTGTNNYPDYVSRATARTPFQGGTPNNVTVLTSAQHGNLGQKRRLVTGAIVDCGVWSSGPGSANPQVEDFACIFLLAPVAATGGPQWTQVGAQMAIEFRGLAGVPGSPCASSGLSGGVFGPPVPTLVQ